MAIDSNKIDLEFHKKENEMDEKQNEQTNSAINSNNLNNWTVNFRRRPRNKGWGKPKSKKQIKTQQVVCVAQ